MKIAKFEEIVAWQKAKELSLLVYKDFRECRDFAFKDQIQRASVSVINNIAEGFERNTNKELKNFLYIAKGSCGEVRSMLNLAKDLEYITELQYQEMNGLSLDASRLLSGFIKTLTPTP